MKVTTPGTLYALTPTERPTRSEPGEGAAAAGFEKVDVPEVQFFPGEINRVSLYKKAVESGERLRFRKLVFLVMDGGNGDRGIPTGPAETVVGERRRIA